MRLGQNEPLLNKKSESIINQKTDEGLNKNKNMQYSKNNIDKYSLYIMNQSLSDEYKEDYKFEIKSGSLRSIAFSFDGTYFATGSDAGSVKIWNFTEKRKEITLRGHSERVFSVKFSPDNIHLASGSQDNTIKIWNIKEKREEFTLKGHSDFVYSVAFSPEGNYLASASSDSTIKVWNIENQEEFTLNRECEVKKIVSEDSESEKSRRSERYDAFTVVWSPCGNYLASGYYDNQIKVWNVKLKREEFFLNGHNGDILSLTFTSDGKYLASGSGDQCIKVWNLKENAEEFTFFGHSGRISSLISFQDGKYLASSSSDKSIKVWNLIEKREEFTLNGHLDSVNSIDLSPDGRELISASSDGSIKVWNINDKGDELTLYCHSDNVNSVTFSTDGDYLASGSDNSIKIWNLIEKREEFTLNGHKDIVSSLKFSPDKIHLASGSYDSKIIMWNIKDKRIEFKLKGHSSNVNSVVFNFDGQYLASGSFDKTIKVWNVQEKKEEFTLKGHSHCVNSLEFSSDGKYLISSSYDKCIIVWNFQEKRVEFTFGNNEDTAISLALSPNGMLMATGMSDEYIKVWNLKDRREEFTLNGLKSCVNSVAFSPDSNYLISGCQDYSVKVWNIKEIREEFTIYGHSDIVSSVCFSPDGKRLASASSDNTVKVWNLYENKEIFTLNNLSSSGTNVNYQNPNLYLDIDTYFVKIMKKSSQVELIKNIKFIFPLVHAEISTNLKYILAQSLSGFEIYDLDNDEIIDCLAIKKYENSSLLIEYQSKEIEFILSKELIINNLIVDLLKYQKEYNCIVEISKNDIYTLIPKKYNKKYYQEKMDYLSVLSNIKKDQLSIISTQKYYKIFINDYYHTLAHLLSFKGKESELKNLFVTNTKVEIFQDCFGKSPIFYAIKKMHLKCAEIFLKYFIESKFNDEIFLYNQLSKLDNEFALIIEASFKELPKFLDKFIFENDYQLISENITLPISLMKNDNYLNFTDFENIDINENSISTVPSLIKRFAIPMWLNTYSEHNILLLESINSCKNTKIFENFIIRTIIDNSWNKIINWLRIYSAVSFLAISLFTITIIYGRTNLFFHVPFLVCLFILFLWESIQLYSLKIEYFKDPLNYVDILMPGITIYWSFGVFFQQGSIYEEYLLSLMLLIRGLYSFRIIDGTRYYLKLIFYSLGSIKYFLFIFFYSNFFFTLLIFIANRNNDSFSATWVGIWKLFFTGEHEQGGIDTISAIAYTTIITATVMNVILMLNLLISILGDSYDLFMIEKNIYDYKEKLEACIEIQKTLVWNKRPGKKIFYQILSPAFQNNEDSQNYDWEGKILYSEKRQEKRIEELITFQQEMQVKIENNIENKVSRIERNIKENITGMESKIYDVEKNLESKIKDNIAGVEMKIESLDGKIIEILNFIKNK